MHLPEIHIPSLGEVSLSHQAFGSFCISPHSEISPGGHATLRWLPSLVLSPVRMCRLELDLSIEVKREKTPVYSHNPA
jgi:hypothetical protein